MLKKRTLLLGAALAAFGAMMVGGAFAIDTATKTSGQSGTVGITGINAGNLAVQIGGVNDVVASGNPEKAADVQANDADTNYVYSVSGLDIDQPGSFTGTCDPGNAVSVSGPAVAGSVPINGNTGDWENIGDFNVKFAFADLAGPGCSHADATVELVFTATAAE
ncbi:MAG: hypothetical protein IT303_11330 [Dehalococcoidia bacterium]|nr:hypothetical protein [Dehalococcoidia bacterium]